jgi:transposase
MAGDAWVIYQEIFPEHVGLPGVRGAKCAMREILNAIGYQARTGGPWRDLPHDFPL